MDKKKALKLAKKYINNQPRPRGLMKQFKKNGLGCLLDEVYELTAQYILENENAPDGVKTHLKQILPSIAFYKVLIKKEGSKEKALETFEKFCFVKVKKFAKLITVVMKIPGLYKKVPSIMEMLLAKTFGEKCGFKYIHKDCKNGFAADMLICPYFETCKKYGCPEFTQMFCKSDDICYGNMHPKLVWARTKTLGMGGDCCDFKLYIKKD